MESLDSKKTQDYILGFPSVRKRPIEYRYLSRIYRENQSLFGNVGSSNYIIVRRPANLLSSAFGLGGGVGEGKHHGAFVDLAHGLDNVLREGTGLAGNTDQSSLKGSQTVPKDDTPADQTRYTCATHRFDSLDGLEETSGVLGLVGVAH